MPDLVYRSLQDLVHHLGIAALNFQSCVLVIVTSDPDVQFLVKKFLMLKNHSEILNLNFALSITTLSTTQEQ